jgi:signal transduction histidine kinase
VYRQVGVSLGATTLAFALLVDTLSFVTARGQINRSVDRLLDAQVLHETERMANALSSTVDAVAVLGRSRMLSNALVDSEGRIVYVAPFLRDFEAGRTKKLALTLGDFRGSPIATTHADGHAGFVGAPWLPGVVDAGKPHAEITGSRQAPVLLVAWPVLFPETRTTEGVLVAEFDARSVLRPSPGGSQALAQVRIRVSDASGAVLSDGGDPGTWSDMLSRTESVPVPELLAPLGLRVEVGIPKSVAYAPLRSLAFVYLLGTVAVVLAALGVARLVAERLTRPVRRLSAEASRVADSARLDAGVSVEGTDEVAHLARAFNEMLLRLQLTTESRLSALREQNAELVRAYEAQKRLEEELHQAQKLEAVGRLAAGIAHEINTPTQYIGDNTRFLADAVESLSRMLDRQRRELERVASLEVLSRLDAFGDDLDLPYVRAETPRTVARTLEGVRRVATIVRAMREFAHPGQGEPVASDINRSLEATLDVARNEYRYVADVETEFGPLPLVTCRPGDLNQVFLNVIVNAAHAISDVVGGTGNRGLIRVRTVAEGDEVVVSVSDSGAGIPPEIQDKVFEPFFTTKEVGRGSGQGLSIARSIVEKHRGSITFESAPGQGTTFHIRIPREPPQAWQPPPGPPGATGQEET